MDDDAQNRDRGADFGRRLGELIATVEFEIRQGVEYLDRIVVPEVRQETGEAARVLARHLERLAERLAPRPGPRE